MNLLRHRLATAALLLPLAFAVPRAAAQDSSLPRLEFFIRGSLAPAGTGTTIEHGYDPHPGYAIPGSYARQTLRFDPLSGSGFVAGVTGFFGRTIGLRLSVGYDHSPIGGANTPFEMVYKYTSWTPWSGYVDGTYTVNQAWPETAGALQRAAAGLELVVRLPLGPGIRLNLTGGPLLSLSGGDIQSLGYTDLYYERYGALFFHSYFVRLRLPARVRLGLTGGAELAVRFGRHLSLILNATVRSGSYEGIPEITAAYDSNGLQTAAADILSRIKARIVPQAVVLTPSPFLFGAGFAIVL
ncbi:MAG: hypothetical protein NTZ26_12370 [Candidatus Aminicenantes bacterium]|nr:hypothetical protein [Candidatus Aminicenantes bacterium]